MMSYDMKKTGDRIRQLRTQKGYTQEQIAQALNIDRSFYGRIELGQKGCSVDFLIRLSSFLRFLWITLFWAKTRLKLFAKKLERC